MAGSIREKQKKVREQGYAAARNGTLYPRELQNAGDYWEDAQVYGNTRQGQNNRRNVMAGNARAYQNMEEKKQEYKDEINERKQRMGLPTTGPMADTTAEIRRRRTRNAIADRLLKKGNISKRKEKW